ncbi:FTR1 family iron permease [Moraxella marmotae]|uniref:FTR1 family iron permease n=1 Tax=Moraxella marmotae TaxID=3344520 RepID=UPI0035F229FA
MGKTIFRHFSAVVMALVLGVAPSVATIAQANTPVTQVQADAKADKSFNFSPVFVMLSDAMTAQKAGDMALVQTHLTAIGEQLAAVPADADQKSALQDTLNAAMQSPTPETMATFSSQLYELQKSLNPVDYTAERQAFAKKINPAFDELAGVLQAMNADDADSVVAAKMAYDKFNRTWVANERVVRNTSKGHYGKIEVAMALMRVAIETTPANREQLLAQTAILKQQLDSYNQGDTEQSQSTNPAGLSDGIALLQDGLAAFQAQDAATGSAKLGEFISLWTSIEGEVSTRNPSLYTRIESQIPVIMAQGQNPKHQQDLADLIEQLQAINPQAGYTAVDAMLILLREGLEALLIVVALISALVAAKQTRAKIWVYAGVVAGLFASILGAVALQMLFPAVTSGTSREMIEGVVGIVAVVMMVGVGAWLHSKSSVKSWNQFIKRQMNQALGTGSFVGLFALSFLSVFREGAETILFYAGILPSISTADFLTGIGLALVILALIAVILLKTSVKLPIPKLFLGLTLLIYGLGFKILGVSVAALQLTNHLPRTVLDLPSVVWAGFYPTAQGVAAQLIFVLAIVVVWWCVKRQENAKL